MARAGHYSIALQGGSATISAGADKMQMRFVGARNVIATAGDELPGKINYIRGSDPKLWQIGLATYASVTYLEIYPGVGVVYRGNQGRLEFDLILKPRADANRIRLNFSGAQQLSIDNDGALLVRHSRGAFRILLPAIYQDVQGIRKTVQGRYVLLPHSEVVFRLATYNRSEPLVIDPAIAYSYLLGGGTGSTNSQTITVDASGNAYIAGHAGAQDLATVNAPYPQANGTGSAFISKLDPTGTTLLYSTYINGIGNGTFTSIALDSSGNAWLCGWSTSTQFPLVSPYQSAVGNGQVNAVVMKLGPTGGLLFSTYLGAGAQASGIAIDPNGNAYVAGWMLEGTIPTTSGAYSAVPSSGFVSKFSSAGGLAYSTYLCGEALAIAADSLGSAYVTGSVDGVGTENCLNVPAGGAQSAYAGNGDAYVAKLNPSGSALLYFTFLGGSQADSGNAIAVDGNGNAYVGGSTASVDFPVTPGALQTVFGGAIDGFVAKLNSTGSSFQYVTYLGSNRDESVTGLAIDGNGSAYVTGSTDSANFPTVSPIDAGLPGNRNSLYRTSDAGISWVPMDSAIPGAVTSVSPDPTPGILVAATKAGIYRSVDSGQTWTQTSTSPSASLSRSPANGSFIYGVYDGFNVSTSTDGGVTWGYIAMTYSLQLQIIADPIDANTAYAYDPEYQSYVERFIGGNRTVLQYLPCYGTDSFVTASGGPLYVDFYQCGVYKSTDHGFTWSAANTGLPVNVVHNGLAVAPSNPSVLYRSNFSNPVSVTTNGGASWSPTGIPPTSLGPLAVSATNPSIVYAAAMAGPQALYVSQDGGNTWNPAGAGLGAAVVSQILPDPTNAAGAYALAPVAAVAFAAEINPTGSGLVYSTYLGSTGLLTGNSIALSNGDAFVTGYGFPPVPPTTAAFQPFNNYDAIVVRISPASAACTISANPASQIVYGSGATVMYQISAPGGCAWTASSDSPWATLIQGASGSGSSVLYLGVSQNTTGASRTANVTIGNQTVSVTQSDSSCSYSVTTGNSMVGAAGGVVQVSVAAAAGCPWTVVSGYPTIVSVTSATAGSGNGSVTLSVARATWQYSRTLSIGIANTYLSLSQATPCNVAQNATTTASDVQDMINEALGATKAADDLNHDGVVNLVDAQIVARAAIGQGCFTP